MINDTVARVKEEGKRERVERVFNNGGWVIFSCWLQESGYQKKLRKNQGNTD